MPTVQTPAEIEDLLATHLVGRSIRQLQVTAPNTLKTVQPDLGAVVGLPVTAASCSGRLITMVTPVCSVLIQLERVGRVAWRESGDAWAVGSGKSQPTVRVMLEGGGAIDLIETTKTKRITVSVLAAGLA